MIVGGKHILTAAGARLNATRQPCRVITFRLESGADDCTFGDSGLVNGEDQFGFLQADESWTFGPDAGTIDPYDLYVKGTAGNTITWVGLTI